ANPQEHIDNSAQSMNEKLYQTGFQAPPDTRIYAMGDIHGCFLLLKKMHEAISFDLIDSPASQVYIIYLGDYVDRGAQSKEVLDCLIERQNQRDDVKRLFLLGNHEHGMLDFALNPQNAQNSDWLDWGGVQTLKSYGMEIEEQTFLPAEKEMIARKFVQIIPLEHLGFLQTLSHAFEIGEYFFAHAGVNPARPVNNQDLQDLFFIREPFLSWPEPLSHMIVPGHSKTKGKPEILPHRINVDTGAYETGVLCAAVIDGISVRFINVRGNL
ncbi:MAG: metallophosphoesterase, partial [Alphaproteobacteria bacterium]